MTEPLRMRILHSLGGVCGECGIANPDVLAVVADKTVDDIGNRPRWLEYCYAHLDRCRILCLNCKALWLKRLREAARQEVITPARVPWLIWRCPYPKDTTCQVPWLNRHLTAGMRVGIVFEDDEVWEYGKPYTRIGTWEEFRAAWGGPAEPPDEGTMVID